MRYIDLLMIERGYGRRYHHAWTMVRWQTFNLMLAQTGSDSMHNAGIYRPTDLLKFPWEYDGGDTLPTADEVAQAVAEMNVINAQLQECHGGAK